MNNVGLLPTLTLALFTSVISGTEVALTIGAEAAGFPAFSVNNGPGVGLARLGARVHVLGAVDGSSVHAGAHYPSVAGLVHSFVGLPLTSAASIQGLGIGAGAGPGTDQGDPTGGAAFPRAPCRPVPISWYYKGQRGKDRQFIKCS